MKEDRNLNGLYTALRDYLAVKFQFLIVLVWAGMSRMGLEVQSSSKFQAGNCLTARERIGQFKSGSEPI